MRVKFPARLTLEYLKEKEWLQVIQYTVGNRAHFNERLISIKSSYKLDNRTWRIVLTTYSRM